MRDVVAGLGPSVSVMTSSTSRVRPALSSCAPVAASPSAAAAAASQAMSSSSSSSSPPPADECNSSATKTPRQKPRVPPEDLSYDSDGFYQRAATVCVRDASEREVLLVSSPRWGPDCWLVPGGKVQRGESCEVGAAREALEEAGVTGRVGRCLGTFDNPARRHRTWVYVLRVDALLEDYQEADIRRRRWFRVEQAKQLLVGRHATHLDYVNALEKSKQQQQSAVAQQAVMR